MNDEISVLHFLYFIKQQHAFLFDEIQKNAE